MKRPCPGCGGFGTVTIAHDTGVIGTGYLYEETCPTCDGEAEIEALCEGCEQPLRDDGWCASCEEWGEQFTETKGDPLPQRRAA